MVSKYYFKTFYFASILILSACGGGGGGAAQPSSVVSSVATTSSSSSSSSKSSASSLSSTSLSSSSTGSLPSPVTISGWIGTANTLINFPEIDSSLTFLRNESEACIETTLAGCSASLQAPVSSLTLTDTYLNLSSNPTYGLKKNGFVAKQRMTNERFLFEEDIVSLEFKGRIWVFGRNQLDLDIWSSIDGSKWFHETKIPNFGLYAFDATVFNDSLWLASSSGPWKSDDGIHWVQTDKNVSLTDWHKPKISVFNNRMWIVNHTGTVSSSDGNGWRLESANAAFGIRTDFQLITFNNKLWVIGGYGCCGALADIWSSTDGVTWINEQDNAPFGTRNSHKIVELDNKLWLIGNGTGDLDKNDVWSSPDAINWVKQTSSPSFKTVGDYAAIAFKAGLYRLETNGLVYVSTNGIAWNIIASDSDFPPRMLHQAYASADKLFIAGGHNSTEVLADIWSSVDGISWNSENNSAPFGKRYGHQIINFKDKFWLIGGSDGTTVIADIWSSVDGITWELESSTPEFGARVHHQVAIFKNKLWLSGGRADRLSAHDLWSSEDGITWTKEFQADFLNFGTPFHELAAFNNKLYMAHLGGSLAQSMVGTDWNFILNIGYPLINDTQLLEFNNKLWMFNAKSLSSVETSNQVKFEANLPYLSRQEYSLSVFRGEVYMIGGGSITYDDGAFSGMPDLIPFNNPRNDIWKSSDGITWKKAFKATFTFQ